MHYLKTNVYTNGNVRNLINHLITRHTTPSKSAIQIKLSLKILTNHRRNLNVTLVQDDTR